MSADVGIMALQAAKTAIDLRKSIEFEQLKEAFLLVMDELDANFMEDLDNTSPDFMKDYLKACVVAKKMGRRYRTHHVQEHLEANDL